MKKNEQPNRMKQLFLEGCEKRGIDSRTFYKKEVKDNEDTRKDTTIDKVD